MSDTSKVLWSLVGGMVLGAFGASAIGRGKFRPCATKLLSYGYDAKDCIVNQCELLKENIEDMAAEAKEQAEDRKAEKEVAKETVTEEVDIVVKEPKA